MNGTEQLILLAEVSISLAGFAGIVSTFQYKNGSENSHGDALGLAMMVHCGLLNAFFAVLPMAIYSLGVNEQLTWNISSSAHCVNYVLYFGYIINSMRKIKVRRTSTKVMYGLLYAVGLVVLVFNFANAFNIGFQGQFGPYFIACILPICLAGYMFARLVLRPLWKNVGVSAQVN